MFHSYLTDGAFHIYYGETNLLTKLISDDVQQGSVSRPLLIATFANDTAILSPHKDYNITTKKLQTAIDKISNCATRWKIKLIPSKTTSVGFTLRPHKYVPTLAKMVYVTLGST